MMSLYDIQNAQANSADFVALARSLFVLDDTWHNQQFDASQWIINPLSRRSSVYTQQSLYFTFPASYERPLPPIFADIVKSVVVVYGQSYAHIRQFVAAAQLLGKVIFDERGCDPNTFCWSMMRAFFLEQTEHLMQAQGWSDSNISSSVYTLIRFCNILMARSICPSFSYEALTQSSRDAALYTIAGQEKRLQKLLPSTRAIKGIADIYLLHAHESPDRLLACIMMLLLLTGMRVREVLTLPLRCEVDTTYQGQPAYGIRYYILKGRYGTYRPSVKWIPAFLAERVRRVIAEIQAITASFRARARELQAHQDTVPIPGYSDDDRIRLDDARQIFAIRETTSIAYYKRVLPVHQDEEGAYYLAGDISALLKTQRISRLWTLEVEVGSEKDDEEGSKNKKRQWLSQSLCIKPHFYFASHKLTNNLLIEPITDTDVSIFLGQDQKFGSAHMPSAFERFDIREEDGTHCRMTPTMFRHWLSDIAHLGGLPSESATRWFGRRNYQATEYYEYTQVGERAVHFTEADHRGSPFIQIEPEHPILLPEDRDAYLGACMNWFPHSIEQINTEHKRARLVEFQSQLEAALAQCNGNIAEGWIRSCEVTLARVRSALAKDAESIDNLEM